MKTIVFAGPSISREAVEALDEVEWRPPVSQGDVFYAAQDAPGIIAIIDGYFDGVPAVWHKEILWAISRGIQVFGASSMGALRAAELHQFGMRGVGEIFENFRDGIYEDDDEVAVLHGPAELGYLPLSLPMVNARATLRAAQTSSVIDRSVADALIAIAKSMFYQKREWAAIIKQATSAGIDSVRLAAFEKWLPEGERDLKRQDAESLLQELGRIIQSGVEPAQCDFQFEWTVMWDSVFTGQSGRPPMSSGDRQFDFDQAVLDELRLDPRHYRRVSQAAQLKQFALREAFRKRIGVDDALTRKQLQQLRESWKLYSRSELDRWMEHNDWDAGKLQQVLEDEQRSQAVTTIIDNAVLLDELRLSGDYATLKANAKYKSAADLAAHSNREIRPAQLLGWYFESQLGEAIPADLDKYLVTIGISRREEFYQLLRNHYLYILAIESESQ